MYILKLPWLTHTEENRKHEVYSLSVSPDGTRLATGGLDGNVRIWSVENILKYRDPKLPKDPAICRPLCSIARHTGAVTVVKFSPDGRFLASGSDDKVLLIWEKDEESRPVFGEQNLEHWTVTKRVVAHDNDIQDIAWAPDSSILVSVGLDRSIIIWSGTTFEKIKRFDVHQSHVKGVVFDPANKYFATSSDDRSVRIFRYHKGSEMSFSIERTVLKPFKKSPLTTYFRRMSWSPDGQFIAAPNATNGPVTSVAVITRGNWDSDISLIGHDSPCEVASFSPVLYEVASPTNPKEKKISSIVATAGQDKNLVIWNNVYPRPIAVFEEISLKTMTDLCWTPDGLTLFVCSLDGSISVITFEPGELGQVVSSEKNDELLNKYGVDKDAMVFPESTSQLILEDKAAEFAKTLRDKHMDRLMSVAGPKLDNTSTPTTTPPPRPITPLLSTTGTTNIIKSPTPKTLDLRSSTKSPKALPPTRKLNKAVLSNGKKRVAPTLISTSSHTASTKFKSASVITKPVSTQSKSSSAFKNLSKTPYDLPRFGIQTSVNPYFIKKTSIENEEEDDENDEIADYEDKKSEEEVVSRRRKTKPTSIIKLHQPYEDTNILYKQLSDRSNPARRSILQVINQDEYVDDEPTELISQEDGELVMEHYIPDRIISITGQLGKFWALATSNGAVLTFRPSGRILVPRIELGSNIVKMSSSGDVLMIVTEDFMLHCYDLMKGKRLHKKVSMAPILHYEDVVVGRTIKISSRLVDVELHGDKALVYLDNNEVYYFDAVLKTWVNAIDKFYGKYNVYDGVWVDRLREPYISQGGENPIIIDEDEREIEYVKKLSFLEGYQTLMKTLGKGAVGKEVSQALEEMKSDELYAMVRRQ